MTRLPFPLSDIRLPRAPDTPKNERPLLQIPANRRHPRPQNGTKHSPTDSAAHLETTRRIPNRHTLKTPNAHPTPTPLSRKTTRHAPGAAHSRNNPSHTLTTAHSQNNPLHTQPPHANRRARAKRKAGTELAGSRSVNCIHLIININHSDAGGGYRARNGHGSRHDRHIPSYCANMDYDHPHYYR